MWESGNTNRRPIFSDSEAEDDDEKDEQGSGEEGAEVESNRDPYALPEESDDEEEMAELRRKVLAARPFVDTEDSDSGGKPQPQKITQPASSDVGQPSQKDRLVTTGTMVAENEDVGTEDDSDDDDEEDRIFDNIINATTTTDRTGILALQRRKQQESTSFR
ncbi:hypothetical protein VTO42DRAFT_4422 [Malbranchea cinnamomea]